MSSRLLFRVDPMAGESPRGYLCRTAHEHAYCSPNALAQIAGLWVSGTGKVTGLDHDAAIEQLSYTLRLEPDEWRSMCYHHVKGRNRFKQRSFCGETVSADDLNYGSPRLCPACVRERPIWWAAWDLGLVVACPIHRCLLLNECSACKRRVAWERPGVYKCRCGHDFRHISGEPADPDLVAITAAIYRAAGFAAGKTAGLDLNDCAFPLELLGLRLGALLRLIIFVGSMNEGSTLRRKQRHFGATNLAAATEICRGAVTLLRDWPQPLREVLRQMVPQAANPATLNFSDIFGNFYRHLFRVLPRSEFGFLHDVFERFVIEDWPGLIRGQHRYFSSAVRRNSQWVTANEAERVARTTGARIWDLARQGQVDATFLKVRGEGSRTECWIRRESLNQWIAAHDAELARYMSRPEAEKALGLKNFTLATVAAAGAIRYLKGPERHFPARCFFFLREDVLRIRDAFEKHSVPVKTYSKPGEFIALRHAMKNYLGRDSGLAAVIRAVVGGSLVPVGFTNQFRGITGYLFLSEDLRKYRPVQGTTVSPEGVFNYGEAAAVLGVATPVIRGLIAQGILHIMAEYRNGLSKLLPAADVRRFAEGYVATSALAKRYHLDSGSLARYLRESGTPLLAIPLPGTGRDHAFFLRKDVPAQPQLPSRRMLRDAARQRIVAARKQRWAEYRQAKETALGKPLRRVRAS